MENFCCKIFKMEFKFQKWFRRAEATTDFCTAGGTDKTCR